MLEYLLDTNIVIYTMKNRPERVKQRFKQQEGRMAVSTVTVGELVYGAEHSRHPQQNLSDIEAMLARLDVLPFDNKAAYHFGRIRAVLHASGEPIGAYDMMLAGQARAHGLILVTNNRNEFDRVPSLMLEDWSKE